MAFLLELNGLTAIEVLPADAQGHLSIRLHRTILHRGLFDQAPVMSTQRWL